MVPWRKARGRGAHSHPVDEVRSMAAETLLLPCRFAHVEAARLAVLV